MTFLLIMQAYELCDMKEVLLWRMWDFYFNLAANNSKNNSLSRLEYRANYANIAGHRSNITVREDEASLYPIETLLHRFALTSCLHQSITVDIIYARQSSKGLNIPCQCNLVIHIHVGKLVLLKSIWTAYYKQYYMKRKQMFICDKVVQRLTTDISIIIHTLDHC